MRIVWLFLGFLALGCGVAGVFLPLVPATPFLLVAAYAFARSSPRLHNWLLTHKRFGPLIQDWRQHGAIPRDTKILAALLMIATFGFSVFAGASALLLTVQGVVLSGAAAFVLSRPRPPRERTRHSYDERNDS